MIKFIPIFCTEFILVLYADIYFLPYLNILQSCRNLANDRYMVMEMGRSREIVSYSAFLHDLNFFSCKLLSRELSYLHENLN